MEIREEGKGLTRGMKLVISRCLRNQGNPFPQRKKCNFGVVCPLQLAQMFRRISLHDRPRSTTTAVYEIVQDHKEN